MSRGGGGGGVGVKKHISPFETSVYLSTWYAGGKPVKKYTYLSKTSVYLSTCYTHGTKTQTMVRRSMGRQKEG